MGRKNPIRVLHVTPEMAPLVKMGGLGDVVGSLPKALNSMGADCRVLMPNFKGISEKASSLSIKIVKCPNKVHAAINWRVYSGTILRTQVNGVKVYLLDQPELFSDLDAYPKSLTCEAVLPFIFLSMGALELGSALGWTPQVLHLHDWPAAPAASMLKWHRHYHKLRGQFETVLTIHNLAHQGIVSPGGLEGWGFNKNSFSVEGMEFYGHVNLLKGGIIASDRVTTVSPRYSWDIQTKEGGMGLDGVLFANRGKLSGILNGVDYDVWNPSVDPLIPSPYTTEDLSGKIKCRTKLLSSLGWDDTDDVLVAFVGRLVEQKGIDLILGALSKILAEPLRLVILGSGHPLFEERLRSEAKKHPQKIWVSTDFDESMAHRIYAGSDLMLMPSQFEPCGLSQLIAMAYGTIPVARATGGIADTVIDADGAEDGNGFLFIDYSPEEMMKALKRALSAMGDPKRRDKIRRNCMTADFSWRQSARAYMNIYEELLGYR
ncbi:MAG: glycogen synthase [Thermanaerothrix sp.]|nr:glycogen synthase [Thermanaerothrix sp.]